MSVSNADRATRLVRALAGVADARIDTAPNGRIISVYVVPETGFSPHRVSQNVRSGLMAATGIILEPGRVFVVSSIPEPSMHNGQEEQRRPGLEPVVADAALNGRSADPLDAFTHFNQVAPAAERSEPPAERPDAAAEQPKAPVTRLDRIAHAPARFEAPADDLLAPAPADHLPPAQLPATPRTTTPAPQLSAHGRQFTVPPVEPVPATAPDSNGRNSGQPLEPPIQSAWPVFNRYGNMPRVELLELQRDDTGAPRCRIIIESDGRRFLGTATNVRGSETTADLIAGAILHALESLMPCDLHFDGMADVIIAGQRHVVVSLRNTSDWSHALSGAAAVHDSVEHAIATAILNAIGIGIAHTFLFMNRSVNHR